MNQEQLNELKLRIKTQEENLYKDKIVFNIYEKLNYFKNNFDANCLINIYLFWVDKNISMSFVSGYKNIQYTVIDSDQMKKSINVIFPHEVLLDSENQKMAFKNNPSGYNYFIKTLLKDKYTYFTSVALDVQLDEKLTKSRAPKI